MSFHCELSFGEFHLHVQETYLAGETRRTLHGNGENVKLEPAPLKILECLLRHPYQELKRDQLAYLLHGTYDDPGGNVSQHILSLRTKLGDTDKAKRKFIATVPGGYKFIAPVRRRGECGGSGVVHDWVNSKFFDLLATVKQELRIVTVAFSCGIQDLRLDELLAAGVQIKILLMNPKNTSLVDARQGLRDRDDMTTEKGVLQIEEQLKQLLVLRDGNPDDCKGTLEIKLSNRIPPGFVALSPEWAIVGLFLAHRSYVHGPMMEAQSYTRIWKTLSEDFDRRWEDVENELVPSARKGGSTGN